MKIRTITAGFSFHDQMEQKEVHRLAEKLKRMKQRFEHQKYQVQTIRMSTQPWEEYADTKNDLLAQVKRLHQWMNHNGVDYFNIGPTEKSELVGWTPDVLTSSDNVFCTVKICDENKIFYDVIEQTARIIKKNADLEPMGFANLRFAALCNISPGTPFFPACYHNGGKPSFALGFENSDLVYNAFRKAESLEEVEQGLFDEFMNAYTPIESYAIKLSQELDIIYDGIDSSVSTSIEKNESIAYAYEHLFNDYRFGRPGSLTLSKIITDTIKRLPIKKTGYCGLMLPVLEDDGLARRNSEQRYSLTHLLLFSSVCGTGLDTIPLSGSISESDIERILCDVASLSIKLKKPLSARLMPIPGKKPGDLTEYSFPYFKNSVVMNPG